MRQLQVCHVPRPHRRLSPFRGHLYQASPCQGPDGGVGSWAQRPEQCAALNLCSGGQVVHDAALGGRQPQVRLGSGGRGVVDEAALPQAGRHHQSGALKERRHVVVANPFGEGQMDGREHGLVAGCAAYGARLLDGGVVAEPEHDAGHNARAKRDLHQAPGRYVQTGRNGVREGAVVPRRGIHSHLGVLHHLVVDLRLVGED